jgi:hypothetical protein
VTAAQIFLLYLTHDRTSAKRRVQKRVVGLAVILLAIVVIVIATPRSFDVSDPHVSSGDYYRLPFSGAFLYPYLAYLALSLTQLATLQIRYARMTARPLLRFGLRLITAASLWGLGYVAAKLASIAAANFWLGLLPAFDLIVLTSFTMSIILFLVGSTLPSWGPLIGLDRLWAWWSALREIRRLRPLWTAMHNVLPEIALLLPSSGVGGALTTTRDASIRRTRLAVEILDGYAMLRPWMSSSAMDLARRLGQEKGLDGRDLDAAVEAVVVAKALQARQNGQPAAQAGEDVLLLPVHDFPDEEDTAPSGEVGRIIEVARAYQSKKVSLILAEMVHLSPAGSQNGHRP